MKQGSLEGKPGSGETTKGSSQGRGLGRGLQWWQWRWRKNHLQLYFGGRDETSRFAGFQEYRGSHRPLWFSQSSRRERRVRK